MRERITVFRGIWRLALVAAVASCNSASAEPPNPSSAPAPSKAPQEDASRSGAKGVTAKLDPKADELLRKMSNSLASTKTFQVDADHVLEVVTNEGETLQFVARSRVAVQRPNKFRSDRLGALADAALYYDGNDITIYGKRMNMYATEKAPDTLDAAIGFARDQLELEAPAADLLYSDAYTGLMEDVVSSRYIGKEPIGDRVCHHLAYRGHETDWQIWIEDSPAALPCRFVIKSKAVTGQPEFEVAFSNWQVNAPLAATHFEFKPPPNATQIGFLRRDQQSSDKERKSL